MTAPDPVTLTGNPGEPYLAVDVQPDVLAGVFTLDQSQLDGPDRLRWSNDEPGMWVNIVCDVTRLGYRRGASRRQGVLTHPEAGTASLTLSDTGHAFDPIANPDVIHKGTPLRLRAWGYADGLELVETRRNLHRNPSVESGTTWWNIANGAGSRLTVASPGYRGPSCYRARVSQSGGIGGFSATASSVPPAPTYAARIALKVDSGTASVRAWLEVSNTDGTITTGALSPAVTLTSAWQEVTPPAVNAAAGKVPSSVVVQVRTAAAVDATIYADAVLIEAAAVAGAYFDGDTADDPAQVAGAISYAWTGGANLSPSVRYVLQANPMARWDSVLLTGEVDELGVQYLKDEAPQVTLTAVDLVGPLSAWEAEGYVQPGVGAGDTFRARVERALTEVGRGTLSPDSDTTYVATLAPTVLAKPWQELLEAQEAELGRLWVDRDNRLVVRSRNSLLAGPVRGTLSDIHGEAPLGVHCCMADALVVYSADLMANRALGTRRKLSTEDPAVTPATARRDDAYSQARHGVATARSGALPLQTDGQAAAWAEAVVVAHTYPELRVDEVAPQPATDDLDSAVPAWPAVLSTDLGDRWLFRYHPAVGQPVERAVGVLGIEVLASPDDGWSVRWVTEDAPAPGRENPGGWFVLGLSQLDGPDVLAPFGVKA